MPTEKAAVTARKRAEQAHAQKAATFEPQVTAILNEIAALPAENDMFLVKQGLLHPLVVKRLKEEKFEVQENNRHSTEGDAQTVISWRGAV